jgi:hypothetical protein
VQPVEAPTSVLREASPAARLAEQLELHPALAALATPLRVRHAPRPLASPLLSLSLHVIFLLSAVAVRTKARKMG